MSSDALAAANARIELARTVAFAAGPGLGGALVGWLGGASAFGVAAALSRVPVILAVGVRAPARPPRRLSGVRATPLGGLSALEKELQHDSVPRIPLLARFFPLTPVFVLQHRLFSCLALPCHVRPLCVVRRLSLSASRVGTVYASCRLRRFGHCWR